MLRGRIFATMFVWALLIYFLDSLSGYNNPPYDGTVALVFLVISATISTIVIWESSGAAAASPQPAKNKRDESSDARLRLLLEMLDDKEKARLKARLLNEVDSNVADGELSLEMLLKG